MAGEVPTEDAGDRYPEIDRPVQLRKGASAVFARHEVGDQRTDRRSVDVDRHSGDESGYGDEYEPACQDEETERGRRCHHAGRHRRSSADPVGEEPAKRLGDRRADSEACENDSDRLGRKAKTPRQIERKKWLDEVTKPVDERSSPNEPERTRKRLPFRSALSPQKGHSIAHEFGSSGSAVTAKLFHGGRSIDDRSAMMGLRKGGLGVAQRAQSKPEVQRGRAASAELLDIESLLSEEEREVQRTVRAWASKRLLGEIEELFEKGTFPVEIAPELGVLGLLGRYAEAEAMSGTGAVAYGLVMLELEAIDAGFRSFVSVQGSLSMYPILRYGSDEQRAEWLPKVSAGSAIGCFGLTEPDAGSDPASMRTRARKDGSDYVISGTKMWITNGGICDLAVVWAQTDEGIRGFIVPRQTQGFSTRNVHRKLSLRASVTSELTFDDCRVPKDFALPGAEGLRAPLSCLNEARYGIVWGVMGAARTCIDVALDYATTRTQFGRPIGGFQLTQAKLANMALEYSKGFLLAYHLGRLKEKGELRPVQVSVGKLNNTREAIKIAREARTILGANGISLEYPVIRHSANLESILTYEGTAEIHQLSIGRALTGLDAFS